jgi:hypothetical protein
MQHYSNTKLFKLYRFPTTFLTFKLLIISIKKRIITYQKPSNFKKINILFTNNVINPSNYIYVCFAIIKPTIKYK